MSDFIRTDFRFGDRMAVLELTRQRYIEVIDKLREMAGDKSISMNDAPDSLAKWLEELIEYERPDLKGVTVLGLNNDLPKCQWLILASHPNFKRVDMMTEPPRIRIGR